MKDDVAFIEEITCHNRCMIVTITVRMKISAPVTREKTPLRKKGVISMFPMLMSRDLLAPLGGSADGDPRLKDDDTAADVCEELAEVRSQFSCC